VKTPEKIGQDPDNPQPADGDALMEYSQLPLQPKHISSNSVSDVCKSKHPIPTCPMSTRHIWAKMLSQLHTDGIMLSGLLGCDAAVGFTHI